MIMPFLIHIIHGLEQMIQAVIFDIGGVLIRTEDHAPRRRLETQLGLEPGAAEYIVFNSADGLRTQRGEFSEEENWQRVQRELKLSDTDLALFRREFWAGDTLDGALVDYIRRLHGRYQTAIISNAMPGLMTLVTGKYPIADAFDVIIGSGDVRVTKPDPTIYRLALDKLGRQPDEAIFVDDSLPNIEGARAVGLHVIHYRRGINLPAALAAHGVVP
jgi:epoxide hydrolase-like predicted phosphatase